ncbi:MAG: DUF948 domain-containing protein [Paenibacillaceae bacterium]
MLIELSVAVIAVAFVALTIYLIIALRSVNDSVQQVSKTLEKVQLQVDEVTRETVIMMRTTNQITGDLHKKLKQVDALFESVGEVGEAVNQVTSSMKQVSATVTNSITHGVQQGVHKRQKRIDEVVQWTNVAINLWQKFQSLKSNKPKGADRNV